MSENRINRTETVSRTVNPLLRFKGFQFDRKTRTTIQQLVGYRCNNQQRNNYLLSIWIAFPMSVDIIEIQHSGQELSIFTIEKCIILSGLYRFN